MADLGTRWLDTRLKDSATKDADRIRKELSHKLSDIPINIKLDHSNIDAMRQRIAESLSKKDFKIRVNIDPSSLAGLQKMGGLTEAQARAAKASAEAALAEAKLATERQRTIATTANAQKAELLLEQARMRVAKSMTEEQRSFVAMRASLNGGISAVSSMTEAMVGLFSIHAGRQFLQNIIDIGGQLEKQRISMGAILGDTARANTLFNQIKGLAIKSPFGVVELDQYSKQLAAYGVEQSQLYDMTRRLADISAGAGQDIGRLALALGHVKSATYLTGITLRQFSMNNIPMLKMLAEYYSEVEKRAVSTAEVQKRISQRQVSYEDVEAQIKRMTDEGGMFYNMQEKISESVAAKWKNLRDSMDIMYGDMAEGKLGQVLKDTATALMAMTTHWQEMIAVVGVGATVWGTWRMAIAANNVLLGRNTVATLQNINANRQAQMLMMRYAATYRSLTAEETAAAIGAKNLTRLQLLGVTHINKLSAARRSLIASTRAQSIEEMRMALNNHKIIAEDLTKAVALGQVSKARARCAIMTSALTEAEKKNAVTAINSIRTYGRFTGVVNGLALGFGKLAVALKSLLFSPQLWIFALIAGLTELWMKNKMETDKAIELNDELFNRAEEGIKNIRNMMEETNMTFNVNGKNNIENFGKTPGTLGFPSADSLSSDDMRKSMETWEQFIKEYAATPNIMLNAAYATDQTGKSVHSLAEQYKILGENAIIVAQSYEYLPNVADALTDAIQQAKNGWFDDDLMSDIKDYNDALKEQSHTIALYYKQYQKASVKALDAAKSDAAFAKALKDSKIALEDVNGQMQFLATHQDEYTDAVEKFKSTFQSFSNIGMEWLFDNSKVTNATDELEAEFKQVAQNMKTELESTYGDFDKLSDAAKKSLGQAIAMALADMVTKSGASVDEVKDKIMELGKVEFGIPIDVKTAEAAAEVSALKEQLNKLVDGKWIIDIDAATNAFDVIQKIREAYKTSKDQIENAEPILMKYGFTATSVGLMTDDAIEKAANGNEFIKSILQGVKNAQQKINQAITSSNAYGFSLTDPTRGGKVFRDKKGGSGGSKADKELKEAQTRFDEIKSFLDEYKKYSKTYSEDESINILENLFPTMKGKGKEAVNNFKQVLENIKNSLKMSTEDRKKFGISIDKYIADFNQSEAQKIIDDQLKAIKEYISEQGENYNLYKTLFEKTGSEDFARRAFENGRVFDDFARELEARLKGIVGENIDYDISEVEAENLYKGLNGAYELWKKIVDITKKNYHDSLTKGGDAIEKLLTVQEKIAKKEEEIVRTKEKYNLADDDPIILKLTKDLKDLRAEAFKASAEYLKFYDSILSLTIPEAEEIGKKIRENLNKELKNGTITAREYSKQIKQINDQLDKLRKKQGNMASLLSGGLEGMFKNMYEQAESDFSKYSTELGQAADDYQNAMKQGDESGMKSASSAMMSADFMKEGAASAMKGASGAMSTMMVIDKIVHGINNIVQGMKGTFDEIREMYDALGKDTESDSWEDMNTFMEGFSNASQNATNAWDSLKNGDIGGVIKGGVGSVTSWITAIARGHDKKLDNAIKKSAREVKNLENAYKNLEWEISNQLTAVTKEQSKKMLADLQNTQKELEKQLESEQKKKKSDADKILDMEQSLEEAKQRIRTFYQEMANDRYGIDLDNWADNIANALVNAFAEGKNAAVEFDNAVADIMKDVVGNIIKISVVKPAMEELKDFLFGSKGIATTNSEQGVEITASEAADLVGKLSLLKSQIDNGKSIYTVVADAMKSLGIDMNGKDSSAMTSGIKGITENQADLLASYINAIRADVAIEREMMMTALPTLSMGIQQWNVIAQQQVAHQEQIASNTLRNAEAADMIYELLHRVELGGSYLNVK